MTEGEENGVADNRVSVGDSADAVSDGIAGLVERLREAEGYLHHSLRYEAAAALERMDARYWHFHKLAQAEIARLEGMLEGERGICREYQAYMAGADARITELEGALERALGGDTKIARAALRSETPFTLTPGMVYEQKGEGEK